MNWAAPLGRDYSKVRKYLIHSHRLGTNVQLITGRGDDV
jgi:hypothetical protein